MKNYGESPGKMRSTETFLLVLGLCLAGCGRINFTVRPDQLQSTDDVIEIPDQANTSIDTTEVVATDVVDVMDTTVEIGLDVPDQVDVPFEAGPDVPPDFGCAPTSDAMTLTVPDANCPAIRSENYCTSVPALPGVPVIDGIPECGLTLQSVVPIGWTAMQCIPGTYAMRFAAAWRPDGVYLYIDVDSPTRTAVNLAGLTWCGDAVEFHLDNDGVYPLAPAYDPDGTRQFIVAAPLDTPATAFRAEVFHDGQHIEWTSSEYATRIRPGGYSVEVFVRATDLGLSAWSLSAGSFIGLDLSHDVTAFGGDPMMYTSRLGQYFLRTGQGTQTGCGLPHCDVNAFCRPQLQ